MRVLFATDLHGSTLVFEKSILAADEFDADLLVIGGDLSGKHMLPVIPGDNGLYRVFEPSRQLQGPGGIVTELEEKDVDRGRWAEFSRSLESKGFYWHIGTEEEILRTYNEANKRELLTLTEEEIYKRLIHWAQILNSKLPKGTICIWTGGNDDSDALLQKLINSSLGRFEYAEHEVKKILGYEILSLGYSNVTSFNTARELPEGEILEKLNALMPKVKDNSHLILNVHVPPSKCGRLDMCPDYRNPKQYIHVGSEDVRAFIENIQPLADLAGHVHEGRGHSMIGKTHIFNPGSEYQIGILNAYVIEFSNDKVRDYLHFVR